MLDGVLPFERPAANADEPSLVSAFEQWCEDRLLHPEAPGAWETYERSVSPAV